MRGSKRFRILFQCSYRNGRFLFFQLKGMKEEWSDNFVAGSKLLLGLVVSL